MCVNNFLEIRTDTLCTQGIKKIRMSSADRCLGVYPKTPELSYNNGFKKDASNLRLAGRKDLNSETQNYNGGIQ